MTDVGGVGSRGGCSGKEGTMTPEEWNKIREYVDGLADAMNKAEVKFVPSPTSRPSLIATGIWSVNMLPQDGDETRDWQEFLFACGTVEEARGLAFCLHPDWKQGMVESFVTRPVWTRA